MPSWLNDICNLLDPVCTPNPVFAGGFEDAKSESDTQVAVYATPGMGADQVLGQNPPAAEKPRLQIVARAPEYEDAEALAQLCYNALSNLTDVTLSGHHYIRLEALQYPFDMGPDDNARRLIGFNVQVWR